MANWTGSRLKVTIRNAEGEPTANPEEKGSFTMHTLTRLRVTALGDKG